MRPLKIVKSRPVDLCRGIILSFGEAESGSAGRTQTRNSRTDGVPTPDSLGGWSAEAVFVSRLASSAPDTGVMPQNPGAAGAAPPAHSSCLLRAREG